MTITEAADAYFLILQPAGGFVGFVSGLLYFIWYRLDSAYVFECLVRGFTFSTLPNGLAFVFCSGYPEYASKIPDSSSAFLLGGSALVFMPFAISNAVQKIMRRSPQAAQAGSDA